MNIKVADFGRAQPDWRGKKTLDPKHKRIFSRDGFACHYCGSRSSLVLDHIIPKAKGGTNEDENLVTCCARCNSQKRSKSYEEFIEWREAAIAAYETFFSMQDCVQ